ncbi:MAG TPA: hypothetical protein DCM36_08445 [Xanthomonadaceae bacterium]|nr:hypothetical protein [Xanthomonadaceae bacterium]
MSIVLYVGGSRDGEMGSMPWGLRKSMLETENGPEIYVERMLPLCGMGTVRVMALESLQDDAASARAVKHYAARRN